MNAPTPENYDALNTAYDYFNKTVFDGALPSCLITFQRKGRTYGYYAPKRFADWEGDNAVDEIALNPNHFKKRTIEDVLSTLVHEMVHLWHQHLGKKPPKDGYHNKEWAAKMCSVGLVPTDTGQPGGKMTGYKVSHYIEAGGVYDKACKALIAKGFTLPYVDMWGEKPDRKKKSASKSKYTCPLCEVNAWAKPQTKLVCGECMIIMPLNKN